MFRLWDRATDASEGLKRAAYRHDVKELPRQRGRGASMRGRAEPMARGDGDRWRVCKID